MFEFHSPAFKHIHDCESIPHGIDDVEYQRQQDEADPVRNFLWLDLILIVGGFHALFFDLCDDLGRLKLFLVLKLLV